MSLSAKWSLSSVLHALLAVCVVGAVGCAEKPQGAVPQEDGGPGGVDASLGSDASPADSRLEADQSTSTTEHDCTNPAAEWLLCEDFESGGGDFDTWRAGSPFNAGVGLGDRGRITLDSEQVHGGAYALHMPAAASSGYQGAALSWRKCEGAQVEGCDGRMDSFETLYFRTWVRFAPDHQTVHHFLNIAGGLPDQFYSLGASGCLPSGKVRIGATVDSKADTHNTFFYTYHPEMSCDSNCVSYMGQQWVETNCAHCADIGMPTCEEQLRCCWGDGFAPATPVPFPVGRWFCFEMMVKANTPGQHDGVMAYWIDGELGHQVDDMMWRTVPEVTLNRVSLQHYNETEDVDGHSNKVSFDDVVVSTAPIGCGP